MNGRQIKLIIGRLILLQLHVIRINSDCNVCHSTNNVACHKEDQFSLCINGTSTADVITCPKNYFCTAKPNVCYPKSAGQPSCVLSKDLCGVCNKNKVYACINETTIAFCYGRDKPMEGAGVSYCLGNTVCDIYSSDGFCSDRRLTKPSCERNEVTTTKVTTETIATATESIAKSTERETTTTTSYPSTTQNVTMTQPIFTEFTTTKPVSVTSTETATTSNQPVTPITRPTTEQTRISAATTTASTTEGPKKVTATTAPSIPRDPNTICRDAAATGSYYADDPTCTTFIVCYISGGWLTGIRKSCQLGQYFPPGAKYCSSPKPDECI